MKTEEEQEGDALEAIAAEFTERLRHGENPPVDDYAARFPNLSGEICELFPTIVAMEGLKLQKERSSDGRASLGAVRLERLGDFRIVREIGRGGMGIVYEAEQESLGRRVAIKVLPRQALLDPKHLIRFQREARIAASLHHTNIVEVFGAAEADGFHYYVMQLVNGVGLDKVIARLAQAQADGSAGAHAAACPASGEAGAEAFCADVVRGLAGGTNRYWRSVASIGQQTAGALQYAHAQGTLHRDIKPANLLVDAKGTTWVADFGLARAVQSENLTVTGEVSGTLRYMAPEQFAGQCDDRSEVCSLGLTLYELLTLKPAYADTDRLRLIARIAREEAVRPRTLNPQIPLDLETVVLKAIARDPAHRYQSAGEMASDLQRFLDDRPVEARQVSARERLWRWCRRNPAVAGLAAATVLLTLLVAVVASLSYVRTRRALEGEAQERKKAEANAELAIEALDRIFERFSPSRTVAVSELAVEGLEGGAVEIPSPVVLSRESAALLEDMLVFYERLSQQAGNDGKLRRKVADASRRVGDIRQRLGQHDQAIAAYQRAIEGFEKLGDGLALKTEVARIRNELGQLYLSLRRVAEARQAHLQVLAALESDAAALEAKPDAKYEAARAHYFLGSGSRLDPRTDQGGGGALRPLAPDRPPQPGSKDQPPPPLPPAKDGPPPVGFPAPLPPPKGERPPLPMELAPPAKKELPRQADAKPFRSLAGEANHLQKAIALLAELAEEYPYNPTYRHLLALAYREQHDELVAREPDSAASAFDKALESLQGLVRDFPEVPDYRYHLSETYAMAGVQGPAPPGGPPRAKEERLRKALEISEKLVAEHPYIPQYLSSQADIEHKLGSFLGRAGWPAEGEQSLRKAVTIQTALASQFPGVSNYELWLGVFNNSLAGFLTAHGRMAEARPLLQDSVARLTRLLKDSPDLWFIHGLLAQSQTLLAAVLRDSGDLAAAAEAGRQAEEHRSALRQRPRETDKK